MKKIGLLSDTHSSLHQGLLGFFEDCDEIWHAGDIGNLQVIEELRKIAPIQGVYGNIDSPDIYKEFPETLCIKHEQVKACMLHIGGYPKHYRPKTRKLIQQEHPNIIISGHSHILKVIYDNEARCLHLNPGAAGNLGFHQKVTAMRFKIQMDKIKDLEIFEAERKSSKFLTFTS